MRRARNVMGKKNVLMIGCGNLGRWHIKGLETAAGKVSVDVVETSQRARRELKSFIQDGIIDQDKIETKAWKDLEACSKSSHRSYDLVIVATPAAGRLSIVDKVCSKFVFKNILIEKPIEQSECAIKKLTKVLKGRSAYVNHARRMSPWHKKISNILANEPQITCKVNLPYLGLACNASHWIDLVNWWTGTFPSVIDTSELESRWKQTKREGFWDIEGTLRIRFENDNLLFIQSDTESREPYIIDVISKNKHICRIDEPNGKATFNDGCALGGMVLPQSQLSGVLLDDLITKNRCDLPAFGVSARCNQLLTSELFSHFKRNMGCSSSDDLPIT